MTVTLCAVGDVCAFYKNPESAFEHVGPILQEADITFAQNERHYGEGNSADSPGGFTELTSARNAEALKLGGFDVMSFASNHCLDLGPEAMQVTIGVLRGLGMKVIGVGKNINEAREPAIFEKKGCKIGFLGYTSVARAGYEAGPDKPGCAPMRAWTLYNPVDYQPGTRPDILTFARKDDLQALLEDVKKLRPKVDVLVLSFHWGIHWLHGAIADYQKEVAHAAIDAGVDIIVGHHPHQLKGIEVYKGKPIFYSMGNFAFDMPYEEHIARLKMSANFVARMKQYDWEVDPEYKNYAYPPESRKSMIVLIDIVNKRVEKARFLPARINRMAQPEVVAPDDPDFRVMLDYMNEITGMHFDTRFKVEGGEIILPVG